MAVDAPDGSELDELRRRLKAAEENERNARLEAEEFAEKLELANLKLKENEREAQQQIEELSERLERVSTELEVKASEVDELEDALSESESQVSALADDEVPEGEAVRARLQLLHEGDERLEDGGPRAVDDDEPKRRRGRPSCRGGGDAQD